MCYKYKLNIILLSWMINIDIDLLKLQSSMNTYI